MCHRSVRHTPAETTQHYVPNDHSHNVHNHQTPKSLHEVWNFKCIPVFVICATRIAYLYLHNYKLHNYKYCGKQSGNGPDFSTSVSVLLCNTAPSEWSFSSMNSVLDTFVRLRKATINFPTSVCPPACPHGTTQLPLDLFSWNFIHISRKSVEKMEVLLKSEKNNGYFTQILLRMRNF